jgi:hypothetical protein
MGRELDGLANQNPPAPKLVDRGEGIVQEQLVLSVTVLVDCYVAEVADVVGASIGSAVRRTERIQMPGLDRLPAHLQTLADFENVQTMVPRTGTRNARADAQATRRHGEVNLTAGRARADRLEMRRSERGGAGVGCARSLARVVSARLVITACGGLIVGSRDATVCGR